MAGRRKTATQQARGGTFASDPPFAAYWGEQETREAPIMIRWLRSTYPDLFVALILSFAALIAFFASKGTAYHQLAIGLLASAVSWLLLTIVLECIWQLITVTLRYFGVETSQRTRSGRSADGA